MTDETLILGSIHPGGGITDNLVYEPLGNQEYLFNNAGNRGKAVAYEEDRSWLIDFNGETFRFTGKPINKVLYHVPEYHLIDKWIHGEYTTPDSKGLWNRSRKFIEVCLDLPMDYYIDILTLIVFESWAVELLYVCFYLGVTGGFGGGKSVTLETLKTLFRHGMMTGDITGSGTARLTEMHKLNLLYDELDVRTGVEDSDQYKILRQGYRRDNKFVRIDTKDYSNPTVSDSFSIKVYSLHSDIERALKTRTVPVNIGETDDKRLPVVNIWKHNLGLPLFNDLFFWYMDNITSKREVSRVSPLSRVSLLSEDKTVDEIREILYQDAVSNFNDKEKEFIQSFKGRNVELGYVAILVSKIFDIDILDSLRKNFEEKESVELEFDESSMVSILKDRLLELYSSHMRTKETPETIKLHDTGSQGSAPKETPETQETFSYFYETKERIPYIPQKIVFNEFNEELKLLGINLASPYQFKSYLLDLGFVEHVNRKKARVREGTKKKTIYCLFIDERIERKIGYKEDESQLE